MALSVQVEDHGATAVVAVRGDLDVAGAPQLREALIDVIADGRRVLVDLEALDFLDSSGLGVLIGGLRRARTEGGELELVCTGRTLLRPFEITGLDKVFTIHAGRDAALSR